MERDIGFELEGVWLKYYVDFHRPRTLRELVARRGLQLLKGNGDGQREERNFWALRGVNLHAGPGEVLGIVGSNGAGKSTMLQVIARIMKPDRGSVSVKGSIGCLLSLGAGFNASLSGRENVFVNAAILGLPRQVVESRLDDIRELSGLGDFFDAPVKAYSSGMRARLGFSVAVHVNPDVLLIDEVVQVGDAFFQLKAGNILDRFRDEKKVIVLVSHSPDMIKRYCTRGVWLEHGTVRRDGPTTEVVGEYLDWSRETAGASA